MTSTPANDEREADVRAAFAAWASREESAPRGVASLVEGVELSHEHVGLLDTDVRGRRVVWKAVSADPRARITTPSIDIQNVDPWTVEAGPLRKRSDHIALCAACGGEKKVQCTACGGLGKTLCRACRGQRKMYGYTVNGARRLLNCTECGGKGDLDCAHCRRGIASCGPCGGQGRVQRWIELEWWQRSCASTHSAALPQRLGWRENPPNDVITRDAELVIEIDRPHRLTDSDLGNVSPQWLSLLAPQLVPGERIERQRLRIARLAIHRVRYRLGPGVHRVDLTGRRLMAPAPGEPGAFSWRASRLRMLRRLLLVIGVIVAILLLARGPFYRSGLTLLSLIAFGGTLAMLYGAAADWTAARRQVRNWLIAAGSFLIVFAALTLAALPRVTHAQNLIAAGDLDRAEEELTALGGTGDTAGLWADLRLARINHAADIAAAREALAQIPSALPQHVIGIAAVDDLILRTAAAESEKNQPSKAAEALAQLGDRARGQPRSVALATGVYVPLAQQKIARADWTGAADTVVAARRLGVPPEELDRVNELILAAGLAAAAKAARVSDPRRRLEQRLIAEAILAAWERASGRSSTPALIALRTTMAHDVASVESAARRHGAS
jgi:hypothetical protein